MTSELVIDLTREAIRLCLLLGGPLLALVLVVGTVCGVLQSATQVHDHTLSFIPKLVAVTLAALVGLPWLLVRLIEYTGELITSIPQRL